MILDLFNEELRHIYGHIHAMISPKKYHDKIRLIPNVII